MPTVTKPQLTLTRVAGDKVKIEVKYVAEFSELERNLVELGLKFQEQIAVMEVDPPSEPTGKEESVREELVGEKLVEFTEYLTVDRDRLEIRREHEVDRTQLQEDPMVGDTDEICCRIRIAAIGLPSGVTPDVFTNEKALFG